jgi:hypothetical protein
MLRASIVGHRIRAILNEAESRKNIFFGRCFFV